MAAPLVETQDWPVMGPATFQLPDRRLQFTAVTDGRRCSVHALDDLIVCGSLRWLIYENDPDIGEIGYIYVPAEHRRHGIATALLKAARAYAEHYGIPAPRHSTRRTELGDAWARADGAEPTHEVLPPDEGKPWADGYRVWHEVMDERED